MSAELKSEIEEFLRGKLKEALEQLPPAQQDRFHRFFPGIIKTEDLESAIDLCRRSIKANAVATPK